MKHISTLLMTVLLSASAGADDAGTTPAAPEARRTVLGILINPSQLGVLALQGERVVSPRVMVGVGVRAGVVRAGGRSEYPNRLDSEAESDSSAYVVGAGPQARFFLTGTAPEGLWLSPQLEFTRRWERFDNRGGPQSPWSIESESRGWSVGGTALIGYSTVVGKGLAVQLGAGVETRYQSIRSSTHYTPPPEAGLSGSESSSRNRSWYVNERVALSLGWAF